MLLVWGRFSVSKTIIPDAQEHFLTSSTRRHTYLVGGLGLKPTTSDAIVGQRVVINTECKNLLEYNWQRLQGGQWNDAGPDSFNKGVQFNSVGTRTYRLEATLDSGEVVTSDPLSITWRLPEITLIPSDPTPVIGHAITVSANLESGGAGASSYQWERKFGEEWREVSLEATTKRLIFHFAETATYRAAVTLTTGQEVRSEPITLTWRNTSVDVTSSDHNPQAPKLITLTANVTTAGEASPSSYRWQYQAPGISWANVGNDRDNLVITHGGGGLREYRAKVTMSDDEVVTYDLLFIEWREP